MVACAGACGVAFFVLLWLAYFVPQASFLDAAALDGFVAVGRPSINGIAANLAHACNPFPYGAFALAAIAIAFAVRGARTGAAVTLILAGANVSSQVLKPLLAHHRELWHTEFHLYNIQDASYPSGHATAAMSLALAAMVIAPRAYRPLVAAVGGFLTIAVSFSILMLAWHFPSDVVGGYLVATIWGLVPLAALRYANERWPERGTMRRRARAALPAAPSTAAVALAATLLVALAFGLALSRADELASFADRHTAFVAVAGAIAVAAAVLLAAVVALSSRRSS
jgi:membrane-associated phospholipid phosphatase